MEKSHGMKDSTKSIIGNACIISLKGKGNSVIEERKIIYSPLGITVLSKPIIVAHQ